MELELMRTMQQALNPFTIKLFTCITIMGEAYLPIAITMVMYYLVDKEKGKRFLVFVASSNLFKACLKNIVNRKRPIGEEGIQSFRVETATSSSFPSGHSMNAATTYLSVREIVKKKWFTIVGFIYVVLVMLSRVMLGCHYPTDTIAGFAVAFLAYILMCKVMERVKPDYILYGLAIGFVIFAFVFNDKEFFTLGGTLVGFSVGIILDNKFIQFEMPKTKVQQLLRVVVIAVVCGGVYVGLKMVLPGEGLLRLTRYALIGLTLNGLCPFLFKTFKI